MDRWMVIWTQPGAEFQVAGRLKEIGFDTIVPAIRQWRRVQAWPRNRGHGKEKREIVLLPAFPRYMLFTATEDQPVWQRAIRVDGVTMVIRRAGERVEPAILASAVVNMLRGPLGDGVIEDRAKVLDEMTRFAKGSGVTVTSGPFANFPGVVVGHDGRYVRVLLSLLGRETESLVSPHDLKIEAA